MNVLLKEHANPLLTDMCYLEFADEANSEIKCAIEIVLQHCVVLGINNIDLEVIMRDEGWNPLIYAAVTRQYEAAKELLGLGSVVNYVDNNGWTALHFAARNSDKV